MEREPRRGREPGARRGVVLATARREVEDVIERIDVHAKRGASLHHHEAADTFGDVARERRAQHGAERAGPAAGTGDDGFRKRWRVAARRDLGGRAEGAAADVEQELGALQRAERPGGPEPARERDEAEVDHVVAHLRLGEVARDRGDEHRLWFGRHLPILARLEVWFARPVPRQVKTGRILATGELIRIALDAGGEVSLDRGWQTAYWEVGWRVYVVLGIETADLGLDLSGIGIPPGERVHLPELEARFEALSAAGPLTEEQYTLFERALAIDPMYAGSTKAARLFGARLERARSGDPVPLDAADPWAAAARTALTTIAHRDAWLALIAADGDGSKPTKKWNAMATEVLATIGVPAFVESVQTWFALVAPRPVVRDETNWFTPAMADANSAALRNLVWACAVVDAAHERETELLAVAVGNLAVRCFTKIAGIGALSTKAGNACIYVLSQLPGLRAVSQLSRLGSRIRYTKALELVEKAKIACAIRAGMEPIDLEELALPTFGLDVTGRTRTQIGAFTVELAIEGDDAKLAFFEGAKKLKSAPAAIKASDELKDLRAAHKELAALVPTLRYRLERWLVEPRSWALSDLQQRYLDHPLAAHLARRLIYATGTTTVMFVDGYPIDATGTQLDLAPETQLVLWHPLGRPASELAAWRALLESLGLTQPIKQLDRETYQVADADRARKSSALFAKRVVKQHRLAALCRERGWAYRLQGGFDGANSPTKLLPAYGLRAELEVEGTGDETVSAAGIYLNVRVGTVAFYRNDKVIALGDVPARCFSETLRDVDLFAA